MGFIYLIQTSKYKLRNINVYKVGMTEQLKIKDRLNAYGKLGDDYFIEFFLEVDDAKKAEDEVLKLFNQHFLLYEGREWFMGNCNEMINIIKDINDDKKICEDKYASLLKKVKKCESLEKYYKDEKDKVWGIKLSNYYDFWPDDKSFNEEFTECMKKVLDGYDVLTYSEGGLVILNAAALRYRLDGYALIK
jgi:hypothetical protein